MQKSLRIATAIAASVLITVAAAAPIGHVGLEKAKPGATAVHGVK